MTFDVQKFLGISDLVIGPVLRALGVPSQLAGAIIDGITLAEAAGDDRTGAQKKDYAMEIIHTAITGINAVKPGRIGPEWIEISSEAIDLAVRVVNAVKNHGQLILPPTANA